MQILASNNRATPPFGFIRTTEALPLEDALVLIRYSKTGFTSTYESYAKLVSDEDGFWFVKYRTKDYISLNKVWAWKYVYVIDYSEESFIKENNEA